MRIIKHPSVKQKENNTKMLSILVNQYIKINKEEVLKKIKSEQ